MELKEKLNKDKIEEDNERMRCKGLKIVDYELYKRTTKNYLQLLVSLLLFIILTFFLLGIFTGYELGVSKGFVLGFIAR